jgi:hypothetical protein
VGQVQPKGVAAWDLDQRVGRIGGPFPCDVGVGLCYQVGICRHRDQRGRRGVDLWVDACRCAGRCMRAEVQGSTKANAETAAQNSTARSTSTGAAAQAIQMQQGRAEGAAGQGTHRAGAGRGSVSVAVDEQAVNRHFVRCWGRQLPCANSLCVHHRVDKMCWWLAWLCVVGCHGCSVGNIEMNICEPEHVLNTIAAVAAHLA